MVRRIVLVALAACLTPAPAAAWGAEAHRHLMDRAIDLLPAEIRPFFDRHREELVWRVNDPDLWRVVGWDENAHHFLDFGAREYGEFPFEALPREYDRAVEKFGVEVVRGNGLLPWRFAEMVGQLRRALEGVPNDVPYAGSNAVLFAAAAAHYIQDAHQPLHATIDYDGQSTGQRGVHSRFESGLFERFRSGLTLQPVQALAITRPRDAAFEVLLASYRLVPALLEADRKAAGGSRAYDDRYYEAFLREVRPLLEAQLSKAIAATAAMITGAWEEAGRPALGVPARRAR